MGKQKVWLIYDGRYWFDQDRAIVMEVCDTQEEAEANRLDYGDDFVVVEEEVEFQDD